MNLSNIIAKLFPLPIFDYIVFIASLGAAYLVVYCVGEKP